MKSHPIEKLVSWLWTGAASIAIGVLLVIRGWLLTIQGMRPLSYHGGRADPQTALVVGILVIIFGLVVVAVTVFARLRRPR
jgi:uncharacterized membrane protein